jgi:hypothetical protein
LWHRRLFIAIILIAVIIVAFFWVDETILKLQSGRSFFFGVELAYGGLSDVKSMVDEVGNYTNLFVLGYPDVSLNQSELNESCDYISKAGLSFIVYFTGPTTYTYNPNAWILNAEHVYGEKFLGVYRLDERGGKQLDNWSAAFVQSASNYDEAGQIYVKYLGWHLDNYTSVNRNVVTSDYALYWFDYKAGYNTVLTEYGFNLSRSMATALCKSAAEVQGKDWGVMITWTYDVPPYIESAPELCKDMTLAYNAGAKYVVIFDYPGNMTNYGILTPSHLKEMKEFWNYTQNNPRENEDDNQAAYVLPNNYGFGFRSGNDTIWGLFPANDTTQKIWNDTNKLMEQYGYNLGIVYDDPQFNNAIKHRYKTLIFWNQTT